MPDFREPDNLRLGFAPLYTRLRSSMNHGTPARQVVEKRYLHYSPPAWR